MDDDRTIRKTLPEAAGRLTDEEATRMHEGAAAGSRTPEATAVAPDDDATVVVDRQPPRGDQELRVGSEINRRFVIEAVLGRGGMGVVYRAKDLRKEETGDRDPYVAMKVLSDEFRRDPRMAVALQREARKAQSLAHPNIATVYDFDRDENIVYLTMEQLDGQPLDQVIRERLTGMRREEALPIIRGLCLGLAYAHNKNIVHSDFKPGNVFLTAAGQVRILDFGIARAAPAAERLDVQDAARPDDGDFDAGELGALTPGYASCEMFEGKPPHPADDVYALAIVAYQLLTGRHPFDRKPAPQARREGLEPAPIRGLKRREWRAIRRALAFDREARTRHASELLRDLEGSSKLKAVAGVAVFLGVLLAAYVGYVQFQESARAAPDISFEQLPPQTRQEINRLVEEAATLRRFGDSGSALMLYRDAYTQHPRNREVVAELESLLSELTEKVVTGGDRADLERLQENLQAVMETDDFLENRPTLERASRRVNEALNGG